MLILLSVTDVFREVMTRLAWIVKGNLSVAGGAIVVAIGCLIWLAAAVAGGRPRGMVLLVWLIVPLFIIVAAVCIGGPGRFFPKEPYEGPTVIQFAPKDGVTALDVAGGFSLFAAYILALAAIAARWDHARWLVSFLLDVSIVLLAGGIAVWALSASSGLLLCAALLGLAGGAMLLLRDIQARRTQRLPAPR